MSIVFGDVLANGGIMMSGALTSSIRSIIQMLQQSASQSGATPRSS